MTKFYNCFLSSLQVKCVRGRNDIIVTEGSPLLSQLSQGNLVRKVGPRLFLYLYIIGTKVSPIIPNIIELFDIKIYLEMNYL